jgi:hypothetical protein
MPTIFDPATRDALLGRAANLAPDRRPLWGRFTAPQMVCHVSASLRQGLGELDAGPPVGLLTWPPLNWLVIHVLPWPAGKGKSPPAFLATQPVGWESDLGSLRELIGRFSARGPDADWPPSLALGRISGRSWGVLQHKHLDHHFRQFGV